jgi:hypothetical protein
MKQKHRASILLISFIILFIFSAHPLNPQSNISGYLSFDYEEGQEQSETEQGTFLNPQLGLILQGMVSQTLDYVAEARIKNNDIILEQALVRLKNSEEFSLSAGLFLVPFGRYNQFNHPHQTLLIHPPLTVAEIYPLRWRELGIMAEGNFGSVFYAGYFGNGLAERETRNEGQLSRDNNKNKAIGARGGLFFSDVLSAAVSYYKGKYDDENNRNLTILGADVTWRSQDFEILSEYSKAQMENPDPFENGEAEGYFIQVSMALGQIWPVVSYQELKYEDLFHGAGFIDTDSSGEGISDEKTRLSFGLAYIPLTNFLIKVEYARNREKENEIKNDTLSIQVAIQF